MERMWAVMTKVSSFGGGRLWKISFPPKLIQKKKMLRHKIR